MATVEFNINEYVWFKLTPHGEKVWFEHLQEWVGRIPNYAPKVPKPEADGYHKLQMWDWMNIFGEHLGMTRENCFETTIRLEVSMPAAEPQEASP